MNSSPSLTILSRRFPAKRVFVTGGGSGLGRALALEFAAAGWHVGIADISAGRLASVAGELQSAGAATVSTHAGDVASEPFVSSAIGAFAAARSGLDALFNKAGVALARGVGATPLEDWRWDVHINLPGGRWATLAGRRGTTPTRGHQT